MPADAPAIEVIDAKGLPCPEPLMLLHRRVAELANGAVLEILTTDDATRRDIPRFCFHLGHQLLLKEEVAGEGPPAVWLFQIRKGISPSGAAETA